MRYQRRGTGYRAPIRAAAFSATAGRTVPVARKRRPSGSQDILGRSGIENGISAAGLLGRAARQAVLRGGGQEPAALPSCARNSAAQLCLRAVAGARRDAG